VDFVRVLGNGPTYSNRSKSCIGLEITYGQIDELEAEIIDYVKKYEPNYRVQSSHNCKFLSVILRNKGNRRYFGNYYARATYLSTIGTFYQAKESS
jgi:hypothetical protein